MNRGIRGVFGAAAARNLIAAAGVVLCMFFSGGDDNQRAFGQPGIRARIKVPTRPRPVARRRPRRTNIRQAPVYTVSLWVISMPPRSKVYVEGEYRGETDSNGELEVRVLPGTYVVRVSREGYLTRDGEVEVSKTMDEQEVEFSLPESLVTLSIQTEPPEAEVYLDDMYRGRSNASGLLVIERVSPNQPHTLRVVKEGYRQQSMPLTSYSGQIPVKLSPSHIRLKVVTDPPEAEVYLDDVYKGTSTADGLLYIEKVDATQPHLLRAKREGYLQRSEPVPANTTGEATLKLSPNPVVVLLKSLKQHAARGRMPDAFADYARLMSESPDHQELPRLLETMLQSLQARSLNLLKTVGAYGLSVELKEAEELNSLYEQARRWKPGDETIDELARYWAVKYLLTRAEHSASVSEKESLRRQARAALSEFGGHNLRNQHLLLDLGWVWWKLDDKTAAQKFFNKAQEVRPDWAYIHFAHGSLAMNAAEIETTKSGKLIKYSQAIDSFSKAVEAKQNFSQAYALRGIAYGVLNRYEEAIASGLQAVTLAPQSAYAHYALGFAYFQKGKSGYRDALNEYNQALSLGDRELDDALKATIQQRLAIIKKALK